MDLIIYKLQIGKHGISSVAVLGHMGIILGNISMTDVKVKKIAYK
jgi:hypothetical protein